MNSLPLPDDSHLSRRLFLQAAGGTAAGLSLSSHHWLGSLALATPAGRIKSPPVVRTAFIYPPSESLRQVGYYSWPGSTFDAEGRQRQYVTRLQALGRVLGLRIRVEPRHLDQTDSVTRFVNEVKADPPDGLFLVPFKKGHWPHVTRIIEETKIPTVVLATLGVLLVGHIREAHRKPGVYMINSLDNFDAVEQGLRMVRAASWMKQSCILNIARGSAAERTVPHLGTRVRTAANTGFIETFKGTQTTEEVKALAAAYRTNATKIVQPSDSDILEAARASVALRQVLEAEGADAVMMDCLPGLRRPHQHVPPCMGFMTLRDQGIPAGCESDLDATLTMMLLQYLFDKPAFQHNPTVETEKNHYFCAHCTSASKMNGPEAPAEPYMLMNHAEAGWGCVPRVLFSGGQEVTIAKYLSVRADSETPQMLVYSGEIVGCPSIPPTGGCRTNAETTINELEDVADLKGHHLCMIYGDYARQLRTFCQLYGIEALV
jgi:L-fucose isomerase-like protein